MLIASSASRVRGVLAAGLLLLAAPGSPAQADGTAQPSDTTTFHLQDLLAEAAGANPLLAASRLEAAALTRAAAGAGSLPDPRASLSAFPVPVVTARGSRRAELRVEQSLPWPGIRSLERREAELAALSAESRTESLHLDLILEIRRAYYALHRIEARRQALTAFRNRLDAFSESARVQYEVDRGPLSAVLQIRLEQEKILRQLHDLETAAAAELQTLARLTDRPDLEGRPARPLPPAPPASPDSLIQQALRMRPELKGLALERQRAETRVALSEKAFYPDVSVGLTYTDIAGGGPAGSARDALGISLSARIPLRRTPLRAQVEAARLRKAQVEAREEALRTSIETGIQTLSVRVREASRTVVLHRDELAPLADAAVETTLAAYTTGGVDYVAFLEAERTRLEVQLSAIDANHELLTGTAALARALALPESGPESPLKK